MQQEFLFLADGAEAVNGKIYVLGGAVDRHMAGSFPANLYSSIAGSVLVEWGETNRTFGLTIRIVDEDEHEHWKVEIQAVSGRPPGAKPGQPLRTAIAIRGPFPIKEPGPYKLVMTLDGADQAPPFRFWVDKVDLPIPGRPAAG
jgi:Family of unknown function (DUF6941)